LVALLSFRLQSYCSGTVTRHSTELPPQKACHGNLRFQTTMDSINETVIFPDRPLFLTHRKRAGNSGTIDLSSANLNGFMPEASSKSGPKTSTFNVQSQPTPVEGATTLSRYRKIKFIDNNVADITKRRSARPRQLKSKRLRSRTDSIKSGSSSQTNVSSDSSIQDDNATDSVEEIVRRPSVAISDAVISSGLTLSNPRSQSCMYSDSMGATMKSIMPQLIGYCKYAPKIVCRASYFLGFVFLSDLS